MGYTSAMWDIAASLWSIAGDMGTIVGTGWAVQVPYGLLQSL